MRHIIFLLSICLLLLSFPAFAQFFGPTNVQVPNGDINTTAYRRGIVGIGFTNPYNGATGLGPALGATPRATLAVRGGILAHHVSGEIGLFSDQWCGLGEGNPGNLFGLPNPYGLSIAKGGNVGFFNLFPQNNREDLVLGFGQSGANNNINRFVLRSYFGTSASQSKDIVVANPRGAVGVNEAPFASLSVYSGRLGTLDPIPGNNDFLAKAIAIRGNQPFIPAVLGQVTTASAMGNQANTSLFLSGVTVEGTRSQVPSFIPDPLFQVQPSLGVAVNVQAVFDPSGGPNSFSPSVIAPTQQEREYAELTWQDLDYVGNTTTECANADFIENANKFYISFRNGRNGIQPGSNPPVIDPATGNSFSTRNKRPVMTFTANGRVGINTTTPTCVNGVTPVFLDVNGAIISGGVLVSSDLRFKENVRPIENALEKIRRLKGSTYTMRTEEFPERAFSTGRQYGFIAQELEQVLPELTGRNSDGYYAVNYTALIPVLTEAIKEQDDIITTQADEIARLNAEMQELRNMVMDIKSGGQTGRSTGYRLEQNTPNPFNNTTQILYALPVNTTGASINVYDLNGRLLQSFPANGPEGAVTVNAAEFPSGIYIYDLLVNGKQMDVKRMVLTKS